MRLVLALLARLPLLALLWWVLIEGEVGYAAYGLLAIPLTLAVSLWLVPPGGWALGPRPPLRPASLGHRLVGIVGLAGWYAGQVVAGAVDVARRLLHREVDVAPVVRRSTSRLPVGPARQLAVGMYGLMPGAVVCGTDDETVWLHSLDAAMGPEDQWQALESRIARAAGLDLDAPA